MRVAPYTIMADSLNDGQHLTGAVLRVTRPDSIPGIENNNNRVRTGPVTRSATAKSRAESPTSLSPDGAELTDLADITEGMSSNGVCLCVCF